MAGNAIKVVGYTRVSRVAGRDREPDSLLSPELQREQIAGVAKREGLKVVAILEEFRRFGWEWLKATLEPG